MTAVTNGHGWRSRRTHRIVGAVLALLATGCNETGLSDVGARLVLQTEASRDGSGRYVIDFGRVLVGGVEQRSVTALNAGKATLTLRAPTVDLPFASDMARDTVIAGAAHLDILLSFSPEAIDSFEQVVELKSDAGTVVLLLKGKGVGPSECEFVVAPDQLDFGTVLVGDIRRKAVQFANIGEEDCSVDDIRIAPDSDPAFALAPEQVTSGIASSIGGSFPITVTYSPTSTTQGTTGRLAFKAGVAGTSIEIPLTGAAVDKPCAVVTQPSRLSFPYVGVGVPSTQSIQVFSRDSAPCSVSEVTLDGASDPTFSLAPQQPRSGTATDTVPFVIDVVFQPTDLTPDVEGRVLFHAGPPDEITVVPLGGNATPCQYHLDPPMLSFGNVVPGLPVTKTVQVVPDNAATCYVEDVALAPTGDPRFQLVARQPTRGSAVKPGSFSISVDYAPLQPGAPATGTLGMGVGPPMRLVSVPLTATPICPQPAQDGSCPGTLDIKPPELDFGTMSVGCRSLDRSLSLSAVGANPVLITSLTMDPAPPPELFPATLPALPFVIGPGMSVALALGFRPAAALAYTGSLSVGSSATNSPPSMPMQAQLKGVGTSQTHFTDSFLAGVQSQTDVLFIVDNSGSMSEEQLLLANNARQFILVADQMGADYRIGVTTTDLSDPLQSGRLVGTPKVIVPGPHASEQFAATVRSLGTGGSGFEQGLEAMFRALSEPLISDISANAGFLRPDARLAVVIVSDEDDQSTRTVEFYETFLKGLKPAEDADMVTFSAVVGPLVDPNFPTISGCTSANGDADPGTRYIQLQQRTGGVLRSICASDWGGIAQDLGLTAFNPQLKFPLQAPADGSTIVVKLGTTVADPSTYQFNAATNSVTINPSSAPGPGVAVTIEYEALCR